MADGGGNVVIRELLSRDLDRRIEEIIKVDQTDEASVFAEIEEYVVTDRIRDHYRELLQAVADSASQPDEAVGVWVSGFFGSGKSSYAKYLGYILANRSVLGQPVAELFKVKFQDERLAALMDFIHQRVPMDAVLFDVSVDRAVRDPSERLAEVLYRVLGLTRFRGHSQTWGNAPGRECRCRGPIALMGRSSGRRRYVWCGRGGKASPRWRETWECHRSLYGTGSTSRRWTKGAGLA